jgi:uncharacterized membrane protein YbhN (UPF0104 family)
VLGIVVVLAILILIVRQLLRGWPAVRAYPWRWNWPNLLLSLAVMQLAYLTMARTWRSVLRAIDVRLPFRTAYWLFYISNLGRYLPGKFWQIGAAALLGRRLGLSGVDMAASMIVHLLYFLPVGTALALLLGGFPPPYDSDAIRITAWTLAGLCAAAAVWPHILLRAAGPLTRKLDIDPERWRLALSRRLSIAVQTCFAWVCLAGGFALFVMSVTPLGPEHVLDLARIYIIAHVIGYIALVAPGGIGVREGAITVLMRPLIGAGPAAGLALLSRLWVTVTELIAVTPALIWARQSERDRD